MSYAKALSGLKDFAKRELFEQDPLEYRAHVANESDRASILLNGSMVERFLVHELSERLTLLNSDEKTRLFAYGGPCGSFASRIQFAQAMGIINRSMRKKIDLIREMRNAAAHGHVSVDFSTPEIRAAVFALIDAKHRPRVSKANATQVRILYEYLCGAFNLEILGEPQGQEIAELIESLPVAF